MVHMPSLRAPNVSQGAGAKWVIRPQTPSQDKTVGEFNQSKILHISHSDCALGNFLWDFDNSEGKIGVFSLPLSLIVIGHTGAQLCFHIDGCEVKPFRNNFIYLIMNICDRPDGNFNL